MRRWSRRRGERGSAAPFVVGLAITLLAVAGLVIDGGGMLNARMRLADVTEQAARAGAQQIDQITLRSTGDVVLDEPAAAARASSYLTSLGYTSTGVAVTADSVTVSARDTVTTKFLSIIGIDSFVVEAQATATAQTGETP